MGADISYNSQKITTYTFYISVSTQKKNITPEILMRIIIDQEKNVKLKGHI
jgi:predicted transcriptional regulator YdeE